MTAREHARASEAIAENGRFRSAAAAAAPAIPSAASFVPATPIPFAPASAVSVQRLVGESERLF